MSLNTDSLFLSLLISGIGTVLFIYGKRETRLPHMVIGGILVLYPYVVPNPWAMVSIAAGLLAVLWSVAKLGW